MRVEIEQRIKELKEELKNYSTEASKMLFAYQTLITEFETLLEKAVAKEEEEAKAKVEALPEVVEPKTLKNTKAKKKLVDNT